MVLRHLLALFLLVASGCAARAVTRDAAGPDAPVPSAEPRGVLRARVDLPPTQGCEEQFDLSMYQDRAVDLIEWDEARGSCAQRTVTIRYLSAKTSAERIADAARKLAIRFEPESQGSQR